VPCRTAGTKPAHGATNFHESDTNAERNPHLNEICRSGFMLVVDGSMNTIQQIWREIIIALGGASILIAAVAWLIKTIVVHLLSKDVEVYKVRISAETERELESFKATVHAKAMEHEVRFSELHEKRGEIIAELYKRLMIALKRTEQFFTLDGTRSREERAKGFQDVVAKLREYNLYFIYHRIYFEERLCTQLDEFADSITTITVGFDMAMMQADDEASAFEQLNKRMEIQKYVNEHLNENARKIALALEQEFRRILGVESGAVVSTVNCKSS
jgi:hypothetical protein